MIDHRLQPLLRRLLQRPAVQVHRAGITADQITLAGFAAGVLAAVSIGLGLPRLGLTLILLNRLMDGLDGVVARLGPASDRGAFLDIAADFLFYALIPLGFAFADPANNALPAAVLIASFIGTGSSFLAYAAVAARRGTQSARFPHKGIYYLGGMTEGAETIAFFCAICLWPAWFAPLAMTFATLCAITTATRWLRGWQEFAPDKTERG